MAHIFISYSRSDSEYVDSLVESLAQENFNVWLDRKNIQPGQNWRAEIVEAIETADYFVLVVSRSAVASKYVRQEVYVADSSDREISSLYMESIELPSELKLPLAGLQIILLYEDWNAGYYKLVEMLREKQLVEHSKVKPALPSTRRAELSIDMAIKVDEEENKNKLLVLLSGILGFNLNPSQIVKLAADKIVIDIPYPLSYELKAQALNNNPELSKVGIIGLSFEGDKHIIPLQSSQLSTAFQNEGVPQSNTTPPTKSQPKTRFKIPQIVWWLAIPLLCGCVIAGVLIPKMWNFSPPLSTAPPIATNLPNTTSTYTPTQIPTISREAPIITETSTATQTLTPSPTASKTPTKTDTPRGNISGNIWQDTNADGAFTLFEGPGIPNFIVRLGDGSCNSVGLSTELTNGSGNFSFENLPYGNYCVSIDPTPTCKTYSSPSTATFKTVKVDAGVSEIVRFGLRKTECVD